MCLKYIYWNNSLFNSGPILNKGTARRLKFSKYIIKRWEGAFRNKNEEKVGALLQCA